MMMMMMVVVLMMAVQGENRFIESMCQTIMSVDELLWVVNHPDVDSNLKKPFMRYFLWVYMKTAGSAVESGAGDLPHDQSVSVCVCVCVCMCVCLSVCVSVCLFVIEWTVKFFRRKACILVPIVVSLYTVRPDVPVYNPPLGWYSMHLLTEGRMARLSWLG